MDFIREMQTLSPDKRFKYKMKQLEVNPVCEQNRTGLSHVFWVKLKNNGDESYLMGYFYLIQRGYFLFLF